MKIDESCIDHNIIRLIKAALDNPLEYSEDASDNIRLITLGQTHGQIRGILDMGDALKQVLKA